MCGKSLLALVIMVACVGVAISVGEDDVYNFLGRKAPSNKHKGYTREQVRPLVVRTIPPFETRPTEFTTEAPATEPPTTAAPPFEVLPVRSGEEIRVDEPESIYRVDDYNYLGQQRPSNKHKGYTRVVAPPRPQVQEPIALPVISEEAQRVDKPEEPIRLDLLNYLVLQRPSNKHGGYTRNQ
ncbi:PREDICTED: uncharacterized protein LOC106814606 [Priapulus caudatus]|uniref:Uncharacterized protein LOC106814606 n=1 Tax=Priapulus caudatus TaxID=37621 RepID=A0ABM1EQF5_PRICU|nr:PREDICTED: uncharacterized protein LOC106814606 [Priapulus caudatus]